MRGSACGTLVASRTLFALQTCNKTVTHAGWKEASQDTGQGFIMMKKSSGSPVAILGQDFFHHSLE